jgi:hypothetical protein
MSTVHQFLFYATLAAAIVIAPAMSKAQTPTGAPAAPPKYSPDVPAKITTPDTVETRIGTLHFKDGAPEPLRGQQLPVPRRCKPQPARAIASFCGSMGHWNHGSTSLGSRAILNCSPDRRLTDWGRDPELEALAALLPQDLFGE